MLSWLMHEMFQMLGPSVCWYKLKSYFLKFKLKLEMANVTYFTSKQLTELQEWPQPFSLLS